MRFSVMTSASDASVNHVFPADDGGFLEARHVRRSPERWICYLSSHTGCSMACRFCHLTASRQVTMGDATSEQYAEQAEAAFATYDQTVLAGQPAAPRVHFNFMARGEPLANRAFVSEPDAVYARLAALAASRGMTHAFKVSTILPAAYAGDLDKVFSDPASQPYYSLYSMSPRFRRRWLPKALPADEGLDRLAEWQRRSGRVLVLHWALIQGENDSDRDADAVLEAVVSRGIRAKFNLVRYNPYGPAHGREPDDTRLHAYFDRLSSGLGAPGSRMVPRVGLDVHASCGTFVEP